MINPAFTRKNFSLVKNAYWDGSHQSDLAEDIWCNQSSISRIVNDLYRPVEDRRNDLRNKYEHLYVPKANEPIQAVINRKARNRNPSTKLTMRKARSIRSIYFAGKMTQAQLAQKYGVCQSTVARLIQGRNWKEIE